MQNLLYLSFLSINVNMGLIFLLFWIIGWNILLIWGMVCIFAVVFDTFDTSRSLFGLEFCKWLLF